MMHVFIHLTKIRQSKTLLPKTVFHKFTNLQENIKTQIKLCTVTVRNCNQQTTHRTERPTRNELFLQPLT